MFSLCERMNSMIQFTKGCTEPAAIALNAAYVGKYFPSADRIVLDIDKMTFKNAYRAGIPNSQNNIGVEFAVLFGYLIAKPQKELEIFDELNAEIIDKAKKFYKNVQINVLDKNDMFIKTTAYFKEKKASAITTNSHTNVVEVIADGDVKLKKQVYKEQAVFFDSEYYDTEKWNEFVTEMYEDKKLRAKMEEAIKTNMEALKKSAGYNENSVFSSVFARMKGDKIRVASCAGSGNKGLVALIAPFEYGQKINAEEEKIVKAALLSCFVTSLITSRLGFISSVCGVVHAAGSGVLAARLYLDDKLGMFNDAFKNYIVANSGVICDGAKKSCAMKAANAVESAIFSIKFAEKGVTMDYKDGMLGETFYETVKNLEKYKGAFGMLDMRTIEILRSKDGCG